MGETLEGTRLRRRVGLCRRKRDHRGRRTGLQKGIICSAGCEGDRPTTSLATEPKKVLFPVDAIDAANKNSGEKQRKHARHRIKAAATVAGSDVAEAGKDPTEQRSKWAEVAKVWVCGFGGQDGVALVARGRSMVRFRAELAGLARLAGITSSRVLSKSMGGQCSGRARARRAHTPTAKAWRIDMSASRSNEQTSAERNTNVEAELHAIDPRSGSVVDRRLGIDRRANETSDPTNLERRRGPGRRLSDFVRDAEEGEMSKEQFMFLMAIDAFKRVNGKTFPAWTDVLEVVRKLGYRKTMASELNLGGRAEDWRERADAPSKTTHSDECEIAPDGKAARNGPDARRAA